MSAANKGKDGTIYEHFHSDKRHGLHDIEVQIKLMKRIISLQRKDSGHIDFAQWDQRVLMKVISFSARIGENVHVISLWLSLYINV